MAGCRRAEATLPFSKHLRSGQKLAPSLLPHLLTSTPELLSSSFVLSHRVLSPELLLYGKLPERIPESLALLSSGTNSLNCPHLYSQVS